MSNPSSPPPPAKPRGLNLHLVAWMLLGGVAAGYLVALAASPELVSEYLPAFRSAGVPDPVVASEVRSLRDSVGQVQLDVAKLKVDVNEQGERDKEFAERVALLESRPPLAAAAMESAAAMSAAPNGATDVPKNAPRESAEPSPAAAPVPGFELEQALETGSVEQQAAQAAPPAAKPAPKQPASGVQIGTAPSVDVLRLNWLALTDRHGAHLKNLQARYVVGRDGNGEVFKLIAGPVKNTAEAKRICEALSGDGVPCAVRSFNGNAL